MRIWISLFVFLALLFEPVAAFSASANQPEPELTLDAPRLVVFEGFYSLT